VRNVLRLVLFGPPGAGKGTQAGLLSEKYGAAHISTGDILREAVARGTEIGKRAQGYMERGELVPDSVVIEIAKAKLGEIRDQGFLLDGFPRTVAQAEALDGALAELELPLDAVVSLVVPEDELVRRLSGRRVCSGCGAPYHVETLPAGQTACPACGGQIVQRADDNPESVRNRLRVYSVQTEPLIGYYRERGLLVEIDALGQIDQVFERVVDALGHDKG
jgi:adenylate kinase